MAVNLINDPNKDKDEDEKTPQVVAPAPTVGPSLGSPSQQKQQTQKGTGFTNIQKYQQANTGNKLGSAIASGIQSNVQQARGQLGQAQQAFSQAAQSQAFGTQQQQQLQDLVGKAQGLGTGGQLSQYDINVGQKLSGGGYQGPQTISNAEALKTQAQGVQQLGSMVASPEMRMQALQRFVGQPGYTQGQKSLDNLLLGKTSKDIGQAKSQALGFERETQRALSSAKQQASNIAEQNRLFGEQAQKQLSEAQETSARELTKRLAEKQDIENKRKATHELIQQILKADQETSPIKVNDQLRQAMEAQRQGVVSGIQQRYAEGNRFRDPNQVDYSLGGQRYLDIDQAMQRQLGSEQLSNIGDIYDVGKVDAIRRAQLVNKLLTQRGEGLDPSQMYTLQDIENVYSQYYPEQFDSQGGAAAGSKMAEFLVGQEAKNLSRSGLVTAEEAARINALQRLAGKQAEFEEGKIGGYETGKNYFDIADVRRFNKQFGR